VYLHSFLAAAINKILLASATCSPFHGELLLSRIVIVVIAPVKDNVIIAPYIIVKLKLHEQNN